MLNGKRIHKSYPSRDESVAARQNLEIKFLEQESEGRIVQGKKKPWGSPGCMVPYFALTLFTGIRPDWLDGEIGKLHVEEADQFWQIVPEGETLLEMNKKDGRYVDCVLFDPVNDSVGKALHDEAAIRIVEEPGSVWKLFDALNRSVKYRG
jgi:hypothetical protein